MFTQSGLLDVFRAPPTRFPSSGEKVLPAYPADVRATTMSQTIVHGTVCSYVRLLVTITTPKAITETEDNVDGMRCEQTAVCCVTSKPISLQLAGSFDTVADLYRLTKKNTVHVLCTLTEESNSTGLATYKPIKIYTITDEHMETLGKPSNSRLLR